MSTRPGCVRHVNGVEVGTGEGVRVGVEVGGSGVCVGSGWFDGEQALTRKRSVKSIAVRFIHRIAALIA